MSGRNGYTMLVGPILILVHTLLVLHQKMFLQPPSRMSHWKILQLMQMALWMVRLRCLHVNIHLLIQLQCHSWLMDDTVEDVRLMNI